LFFDFLQRDSFATIQLSKAFAHTGNEFNFAGNNLILIERQNVDPLRAFTFAAPAAKNCAC
jgi:hypothetical protein